MPDLVPQHILVLYEPSRRGAAAIQRAAAEAGRANARLTVVAVAVTEPEGAGCCDRRAGYWNGVVRDLAAAALALEAQRSGADMVMLPPGRGSHRWFRTRRARRLQHRAAGTVVVTSPG